MTVPAHTTRPLRRWTLVALGALHAAPLAAQDPPRPTFLQVPSARHALYVDLATLGLASGAALNYAFRPWRGLAFSVGFGGAMVLTFPASYGGQTQVHVMVGPPGPHSFEVAAGVCAGMFVNSIGGGSPESTEPAGRFDVMPVGFLGYRYQPMAGGFMLRAGLASQFLYGNGVHVSLGGAL